MKAVVISLISIFVVIAFVTTNTIFLRTFFSSLYDLLDKLPQSLEKLENMTEAQEKEYTGILDDAVDKWKDKEVYLSMVVNHAQAGQFSDTLLPLRYSFKTKDYEAFSANLEMAKNILDRLKQNESITIGTVFEIKVR